MAQVTKLKICDWGLVGLTVLILASGIQLEILSGGSRVWIWGHILVGTIFIGMCGWHIFLHFKRANWFSRFRKLKIQATRILWWVSLLTLLSALITTVHWLVTQAHSSVGAVHGKIGFLMIILVIFHALKRRKFYLRKQTTQSQKIRY